MGLECGGAAGALDVLVVRERAGGRVRARVLRGCDGWYAAVVDEGNRIDMIGPLEKRGFALRAVAAQLDRDIRELAIEPAVQSAPEQE